MEYVGAGDQRYTRIVDAEDVTDAILRIAEETEEWFGDDQIEWDEFWDRMDGYHLPDGSVLDMGPSNDSAAMRRIKKHIRALRRAG